MVSRVHCPHALVPGRGTLVVMSQTLSLGQQLAALSVKKRNKKLHSEKAWSEHMKRMVPPQLISARSYRRTRYPHARALVM